MDAFSVLLLGVVQGLTEFLPVSSSGHLVLFQRLIPGFSQPGVLLDVVLHFGTLIAVIIYFGGKIITLDFDYLKLVLIGSIPAGFLGLFFRNFLESTFAVSGLILGAQFLITAIICFLVDRQKGERKALTKLDALVVGVAQAFAIFPAISRSGATIFAATQRGVSRADAAEFSFLLSIPAILGANAIELYHYKADFTNSAGLYLLGFVASAVFGYVSIYWTIKFLNAGKFKLFGIYTLLLAFAVALFLK